ncbi:hypothetical protein [Caudoviricetes sp.]|nr:hypothetical protein [Caudoviricetes sp.]
MTDIQITDQDEQTLFELFDATSLEDLDSKVTAWLNEAKAVKQQIEINALKIELQKAQQTPSIRDFCEKIRLERINDYILTVTMAEHQGMKRETLEAFLWFCDKLKDEDF